MTRRSFLIFLALLAAPKGLFAQAADASLIQYYFEVYQARQAIFTSVDDATRSAMDEYFHQNYRLADLQLEKAKLRGWQFLKRRQYDGAIADTRLNIREAHEKFKSHTQYNSFMNNFFEGKRVAEALLGTQKHADIIAAASLLSTDEDFIYMLDRDLIRAQVSIYKKN